MQIVSTYNNNLEVMIWKNPHQLFFERASKASNLQVVTNFETLVAPQISMKIGLMDTNRRRPGSESHGFETQCQQELFSVEFPLKSSLPLVICMHNIDSCVRCIG